MTKPTPDADPRAVFDDYGEQEWDRLAGTPDGRFEFEETIRHLESSLPDSGHVLDVGGGAGRFTL